MDAVKSVSLLSEYETISIISTFFSLVDPQFNCAACLKKHKENYRNERKGCNYPASQPVAKYHDIYTFYKCPGAIKSEWAYRIIEMHRQYELGVLPFEGGLLQQPAKLIDAMRMVEALKLEHQKDVQEKAKKWQKTKSASSSQSRQSRR